MHEHGYGSKETKKRESFDYRKCYMVMYSVVNNGAINKRHLTALFFSLTSDQTNYRFPRYNAFIVTDNKMWCYYNLLYYYNCIFQLIWMDAQCRCILRTINLIVKAQLSTRRRFVSHVQRKIQSNKSFICRIDALHVNNIICCNFCQNNCWVPW